MNSSHLASLDSLPEDSGASRRIVPWALWSLLGMVALSVVGVYFTSTMGSRSTPLPVYGEVPEFTLTNQFGRAVSKASLKRHVWIAGIIFTRCPGPCLAMSGRMKAMEKQLNLGGAIKIVSLTADPEYDTPAVLKDYATRFNADGDKWQFLTGPKQAIYDLAIHGLKLAVQENPDATPIQEQFIHSTRLVLIDARGQLRGLSYEGTEAATVEKILRDAKRLVKER